MRIDLVGTTADFRGFGPPPSLPINHLLCENPQTAGRIGEDGLNPHRPTPPPAQTPPAVSSPEAFRTPALERVALAGVITQPSPLFQTGGSGPTSALNPHRPTPPPAQTPPRFPPLRLFGRLPSSASHCQ